MAAKGASLDAIAPNGLSVLRDLDETIFAQVANSGYPISHFHLTSANGYSLARIGATNGNNPELHTVLISRQRLWDCLRDHVPDTAFADRRSVSAVTYDNYRPVIRFSDASLDLEADLVIGADGVRSVVKRAVTGDCLVDRHPPSFEWVLLSHHAP